jgi:hypothetical protein
MNNKWPLPNPTSLDLRRLYEDGFPGAPVNPIEQENLFSDGIVKPARLVVSHLLQTNPGNGKRALLWRSREKFDPGAFGQESQTTGDCTSHGDRSARDTTRSVEIHIKGESEEYYKRGATEPTYGYRGFSGAGMDPGRAARFVTTYGWMVREKYDGCVDLTKYNSITGTRWGRGGPPQCVLDLCKQHDVGEYIVPETANEAMALFQNGYACHSGQNIGFVTDPGTNGIHERSGSWNHDMATVGYDDTKEIWDRRVYFVVNSWGRHNYQWKKWINDATLQHILGAPITGMIVVDASIWERYFLGGGSIYFYSDIKGFPSKQLPDYGTGAYL